MTQIFREFFIDIEPVPASRPRVSRWGTYYGKRYERFRRTVKPLLTPYSGEVLKGPLAVHLDFFVKPPKRLSRLFPRGDIDNYAKGPLDSMTNHGGFWIDDDQITELFASKQYAEGGNYGINIRIRRGKNNPSSV